MYPSFFPSLPPPPGWFSRQNLNTFLFQPFNLNYVSQITLTDFVNDVPIKSGFLQAHISFFGVLYSPPIPNMLRFFLLFVLGEPLIILNCYLLVSFMVSFSSLMVQKARKVCTFEGLEPFLEGDLGTFRICYRFPSPCRT